MNVTGPKVCNTCGTEWPHHPVLYVACLKCDAGVGQKCKRPAGHDIQEPHSARFDAAYEKGYTVCPLEEEGERAAIPASATVSENAEFDADEYRVGDVADIGEQEQEDELEKEAAVEPESGDKAPDAGEGSEQGNLRNWGVS